MHVLGDSSGGLSVTNLMAILGIVVTLFGLLLTGIGVLLLRLISNLSGELADNRKEAKQDVRDLRADIGADFAAVWTDIRLLRGINVARPPVRTSTRQVGDGDDQAQAQPIDGRAVRRLPHRPAQRAGARPASRLAVRVPPTHPPALSLLRTPPAHPRGAGRRRSPDSDVLGLGLGCSGTRQPGPPTPAHRSRAGYRGVRTLQPPVAERITPA